MCSVRIFCDTENVCCVFRYSIHTKPAGECLLNNGNACLNVQMCLWSAPVREMLLRGEGAVFLSQ